jgi:hypothetical protein
MAKLQATVGQNVDSPGECTVMVNADHNHFDYVRYYTFRSTRGAVWRAIRRHTHQLLPVCRVHQSRGDSALIRYQTMSLGLESSPS